MFRRSASAPARECRIRLSARMTRVVPLTRAQPYFDRQACASIIAGGGASRSRNASDPGQFLSEGGGGVIPPPRWRGRDSVEPGLPTLEPRVSRRRRRPPTGRRGAGPYQVEGAASAPRVGLPMTMRFPAQATDPAIRSTAGLVGVPPLNASRASFTSPHNLLQKRSLPFRQCPASDQPSTVFFAVSLL